MATSTRSAGHEPGGGVGGGRMEKVVPFIYDRPSIGLHLECQAIQNTDADGLPLWMLDAVGRIQGVPIDYEERWFRTLEAVLRSTEEAEDAFYLALLSAAAMRKYEADTFTK